MNHWDEIANSIFLDAAEIHDQRERMRFLDDKCSQKPSLRQKVESLLASSDQAGDFLSEPVSPTFDADQETSLLVGKAIGESVGPYRLLQEIGEGGFGVVYMAEQKEPVRRRVALKIIKPGMDTREVIARFEAERQALAIMDHPYIAKVFDAGTTDNGRPYFVMELVKGVPITQFCDENRMSNQLRLELFIDVCNAVQHAHQKGIIHRDLKPSNIMVTLHDGAPMAKVIDFGVAKAINHDLTNKTLFTFYGQMVGTPQYMSPEQAGISATDLDTRSDVYSLGVLLYELLTGSPPLDAERLRNSAFAEMQRIIREEESPKPSSRLSTLGNRLSSVADDRKVDPARLQREVAGDLDWIVMKCLEKERGRRYSTANDLGADLRRHLDGLVVEACPPSVAYRLSKFAKRHKVSVSVVCGFLALLVASSVVAWSLYVAASNARDDERRAKIQSQHSEAEAVDARERAEQQRGVAEGHLQTAQLRTRELEEVTSELQQRLYNSTISRAASALENGNVVDARVLLDDCASDLREWEWKHLAARSSPDRSLVLGDRSLKYMSVSPVEEIVAVVDSDNHLSVYDVGRGKDEATLIWSIKLDMDIPFKPFFSPNGSYLAVSTNVFTGWEFSDRKHVILDVSTGAVRKEYLAKNLEFLCGTTFVPNRPATILWSSCQFDTGVGTVQHWDLEKDRLLWEKKHDGFLLVSSSPDGQHVYANIGRFGSKSQLAIEFWDSSTGDVIWRHLRDEAPRTPAIPHPHGEHLLIGAPTAEVRDARTGELLASEIDHDLIWAAFDKSGDHFLSVAENEVKVCRWSDAKDLQAHRLFTSGGREHQYGDVGWMPDGNSYVSTSGDSNRLDFRRVLPPMEMVIGTGSESTSRFCYSPDGQQILGVGPSQSLVVWDAMTGEEIQRLPMEGRFHSAIAHSPTESVVAAVGPDTLKIFDLKTSSLLHHYAYRNMRHVAFSTDGQVVAVSGSFRDVQALDVATGELIAEHPGLTNNGGIAFLDERRLASVCDNAHHLFLWEVGAAHADVLGDDHPVSCRSISYSPQLGLLAAGVGDEIEVWAPNHRQRICTLTGHRSRVARVLFFSSQRIASMSMAGVVKIWDINTFEEIMSIQLHSKVASNDLTLDMAISPDGKTLATHYGGVDDGIRLWETQRPSIGRDTNRRVVREATRMVNRLVAQEGNLNGVLQALRDDSELDPQVCNVAIRIASGRKREIVSGE